MCGGLGQEVWGHVVNFIPGDTIMCAGEESGEPHRAPRGYAYTYPAESKEVLEYRVGEAAVHRMARDIWDNRGSFITSIPPAGPVEIFQKKYIITSEG